MTVEAYSGLPFQVGSAVAAAAGRGALWAIGVYMRQPLRNTAICALIGLSAMAGANALYKQSHHHPAPLFGSFGAAAPAINKPIVRAKAPVMPVERPTQLSTDTTGSIDPVVPAATPMIGNAQVMALQQKLAALSLFTGTADGLFGPRTAKAIKAFEAKMGRPPRGLLTQQILDLVSAAAIPTPTAAPSAVPVLAPASAPTAALPAPAAVAKTIAPLASVEPVKPLPAPAPLSTSASIAPVAAATADAPSSNDLTPNVAETASIDHSTGIETLPMTVPATVVKRAVPTIAVHAEPAQPIPPQLAPATESTDVATDPDTVASVQRGLNSLGFLHIPVDGVAGEATAKAIRNFEVYYNYDVTGRITKELVNLLVQNGAVI